MTSSASAAESSATVGSATSRARRAAVLDTWVERVVTSERNERSEASSRADRPDRRVASPPAPDAPPDAEPDRSLACGADWPGPCPWAE
jgi:hypothetical protein